jgi:hypothetical protein
MNETFRVYLEHLGRLRERDHWSAWLAEVAAHTTFSEAVALAERNWAWSLFTQGHVDEAVLMLEALIERLQKTIVFDATFQWPFHKRNSAASTSMPAMTSGQSRS